MDIKSCELYLWRDAAGKGSGLWLKGPELNAWFLELGEMGYTNREASAITDPIARKHPTKQQIADLPEVYELLGYREFDSHSKGSGFQPAPMPEGWQDKIR